MYLRGPFTLYGRPARAGTVRVDLDASGCRNSKQASKADGEARGRARRWCVGARRWRRSDRGTEPLPLPAARLHRYTCSFPRDPSCKFRSMGTGSSKESRLEGRVLLVGLASARPFALRRRLSDGPTVTMCSAQLEQLERTMQSGSGIHVLEVDGVSLTLWAADGGQRSLWRNYFENADAVVLVLEGGADIDDEELTEAWQELQGAAASFGAEIIVALDAEGCRTTEQVAHGDPVCFLPHPTATKL